MAFDPVLAQAMGIVAMRKPPRSLGVGAGGGGGRSGSTKPKGAFGLPLWVFGTRGTNTARLPGRPSWLNNEPPSFVPSGPQIASDLNTAFDLPHALRYGVYDALVRGSLVHGGTPANNYNTDIGNVENEKNYQYWKDIVAPGESDNNYDWRGAWVAGISNDQAPDWERYRKPNHPLFTNRSIYARYLPQGAGGYFGNDYVPMGLM